ncbi:MAG: trimethylamine methyltransferase family protein [Victivallaceae bacterium]|nr:trimethylamine methyltransferase family protein [Victivallaceae bacterium]
MKLSQWKTLTDDEISRIHAASLDILENTGLLYESREVRQILLAGGASCTGEMVRFPKQLVEDCIARNKSTVNICNREGRELFAIGDGQVRFAGGHNAVFVMSDDKGSRRSSVLKDVEDFAKICEALEDIDIVGVPLNPGDVPDRMMLAHAVAAILKNSKKPVFFSSESREVNRAIIELARQTTGIKDFREKSSMISQLSSTSPLYWEPGAAESVVECARAGMPLAFLPQPIAGMTAPYTLAGNITVHNAEVLSGVVLAHLVNPGAPLIYAAAWTVCDMRYGNVIIGRPEAALMRIAGAQMARFYHMPSHCIGPDSDSNLYDEQMGWEKMMSLLAAVSGGNDLIVNSGMFGTGMTATNEQLLLDNEMNRFARRMAAGINVSSESIAAELIKNIGPRGIFLDSEHTLMNLHSGEHVESLVIKGLNYENWKNNGALSASALADEKVEEILTAKNASVLAEDNALELDEILKRWDENQAAHE